MALPSNTAWDVRTSGNANNGGGYVPGSSGTDFSQQDAPNSSGTLGTAAGTAAFSDAGHAFVSNEVGNLLQIVSGSGFTPGFYQVVSVSTGTATLDRSPGTGTVAVWALGGGITLISTAFSNAASGNKVNIKSGTYTFTTNLALPALQKLIVEGYGSSHGDFGTRPLITTSTNSTILFTVGSTTIKGLVFSNLSLSNTASTRAVGVIVGLSGSVGQFACYDCLFDGFSSAIVGDNSTSFYFSQLALIRCEVKNCIATNGAIFHISCTYMYACWIHDNPNGSGFFTNATATSIEENSFVFCIFSNNGLQGIIMNATSASLNASNCIFYNNTQDGIRLGSNVANFILLNCIFDTNGGYGVNMVGPAPTGVILALNNAFFGNVTAPYSTYNDGTVSLTFVGLGDIALSGDPFVSAGSNFALNTTAGAGAACSAAGYPGVFPGGIGTGSLSIGTIEPAPGGGGGGGSLLVNPGMSGGMRG